MLLILPILLIMLILVILFFVKHNSIILIENCVKVIKNNWARLVPPIIKLWWNEPEWYGRFSCLFFISIKLINGNINKN